MDSTLEAGLGRDRSPLDELIRRLEDPDFVRGHRRAVGLRHTSLHVNPLMLAGGRRDSAYIRDWRDHAAKCPACRQVFEYFNIETEPPVSPPRDR